MNLLKLQEYLHRIKALLELSSNSKLIIGNAPYHETEVAEKLLSSTKNIETIYLPKYSSRKLNPIELYSDSIRETYKRVVNSDRSTLEESKKCMNKK